MISQAVLGTTPSAVRVLVTVTIFFFVAGMFVDSIVAIVILTPIFSQWQCKQEFIQFI